MAANETQVAGDHYRRGGEEGEQHWDRVHRLGLNWYAANATKYIERYAHKNGVQDLLKARHYLEKLIEVETEKGRDSAPPTSLPLESDMTGIARDNGLPHWTCYQVCSLLQRWKRDDGLMTTSYTKPHEVPMVLADLRKVDADVPYAVEPKSSPSSVPTEEQMTDVAWVNGLTRWTCVSVASLCQGWKRDDGIEETVYTYPSEVAEWVRLLRRIDSENPAAVEPKPSPTEIAIARGCLLPFHAWEMKDVDGAGFKRVCRECGAVEVVPDKEDAACINDRDGKHLWRGIQTPAGSGQRCEQCGKTEAY